MDVVWEQGGLNLALRALLLAFPIYVCFRKERVILALVGLAGIIYPILAVFAIVGASRLGKPNSPWALRHYPPETLQVAAQRHRVVAAPLPPSGKKPESSNVAESGPGPLRRNTILEFLGEAVNRGVLDEAAHRRLLDFLHQPVPSAIPDLEVPAVTLPAAADLEPSPTVVQEAVAPPVESKPPVSPPPVEPTAPPQSGPSAKWRTHVGSMGEAIASDLALHGFVYFGVLLTFVGVFGFLLFAFRDVPDAAQPLVELVIAVIFFVWAWALRRRGAAQVAKGMELLGGLVLPIVVFAGLVDNAPIPPDFRGGALMAAMVTASLLLSLAYAWWSGRHKGSALAYLVGPQIWLAALVLGFIFKTDEPLVGVAITHLVSFQPALAAVALTATLAAFGLRAESRLAGPTAYAAMPAAIVAYLLTVSLSFNEGWVRPVPVLLAGASTLITAELLGKRFAQRRVVSVLRPLLLAATLAPLIPIWGLAWTGVAMVLSYLLVLEWDLRDNEAGQWDIPVALVGVIVGLGLSVAEPWTMVAAWGTAAMWAHTRRISSSPVASETSRLATIVAVVAPVGWGWGLLRAMPDDWAWLLLSVVVLAGATTARWLRSDDRFWIDWPTASATLIALGATGSWVLTSVSSYSPLLLVGAIATSAVALAVTPGSPVRRVWLVSSTLTLALAVGLDGAAVTSTTRPVIWSIVGLVLVIAATRWRADGAPHLALVGHLVGLGSLLPVGSQGGEALVLGAWTLGWLTTVIAGETESAFSKFLQYVAQSLGERSGPFVQGFSQVMLAASVPFAVLETAQLWEGFARNRAWSGVALGLLGIIYAVVARGLIGRRPLSAVLAAGAMVLSVIGVAVAAPEPWESIATAAFSIVVAGLLAGELRKTGFVWFAWLMSFVLVVLLANRAGVPVRSRDMVSLVWGAVLLLGGLIFDDLRAGRRQTGEGLRTAAVVPPVVLGALAVPLSLGPTFSQGGPVLGWWSLATAALCFVVAALLRVGAVSVAAYALVVVAVTTLWSPSPLDEPSRFVPIAAGLVVISFLADRLWSRPASRTVWLRWDLPPLAVAHLVAGVALVRAVELGTVPSTAIGLGVLSFLVGVGRRNRIWAEAGNLLTLLAAAQLGSGWFALALLATAVRGLVSAVFTSGQARASYQAIAAAAAGWAFLATIRWQGWSAAEAVSVSALVFGGLAATMGALVRVTRLGRDWIATGGGLAMAGMVATSLVAAAGYVSGPAVAAGLGLFALGCVLAAATIGAWLHYLAVLATTGAWIALVTGLGWNAEIAAVWTALSFSTMSLVVAAIARRRQSRAAADESAADWSSDTYVLRAWALVAAAGVLGAIGLALPSGDRRPTWLVLALALAFLTVGLAGQAQPLRLPWLRDAGGLTVTGAVTALAYALGATTHTIALSTLALGTAATAVLLATRRLQWSLIWQRPLIVTGSIANVTSFVLATALWPRRDLAFAVLLAFGVQAVAAGLVLARPGILALGPPLISIAFLGMAVETFTASAQWYTVPIAATLLVEVEIGRWGQRRGKLGPDPAQLRLLEWAGLGLLTLSPLAEMFAGGVGFGFLAFGYAAAVLVWSLLTRVRRRLIAALVLATISAALTISTAAASQAPPSAFFWIIAAGAGLALMLTMGLVESYRSKSGTIMRRLEVLTAGWE